MSTTIDIQGDRGAKISIEVHGYENPRAINREDANWLSCTIGVAVDEFSCELDGSFTTYDFMEFKVALEQIIASMAGVASFHPCEEAIILDVKMGRNGHGKVSGLAKSFSPDRASLAFSFETNQTFLSLTKTELNRINREFPIITLCKKTT